MMPSLSLSAAALFVCHHWFSVIRVSFMCMKLQIKVLNKLLSVKLGPVQFIGLLCFGGMKVMSG